MRGEFVDLGGQRLYYYAGGTRGVGPPLLLLHGFPLSGAVWNLVARDFPDGHRLIVADLPGFGRSEASRTGVDVASHAEAMLALLDDLRVERVAIAGHGLGGTVAQAMAVRSPARVSHLALLSSPATTLSPRRVAPLARAAARLMAQLPGPMRALMPPGLLAGLVHGATLGGFAAEERARPLLDKCLHRFTTPVGRDLLMRHLRALDARAALAPLTPAVAALGIPAAVIWGAEDPLLPPALGERTAAAIPGATFEAIPRAAHVTPDDAPERVIAALRALLAR